MAFISFHNDWLIEPLRELPDYRERRMFGGLAGYLGEQIVVVLTRGDDPHWLGVLFPVEFAEHGAVLAAFPDLSEHSVLRKWLFLPESHQRFDETGRAVVARIVAGDRRFGTIPERRRPQRKRAQEQRPASDQPVRDEAGLTIPPHLRA